MSYLVLARKYRPRTFADVVGQEHVVRALSNALESQRLHHAYLFTGTRGVGKTTLARILAACFNCETGVTAAPCGDCPACAGIARGGFMDLIEVDAASRTGVDDTRDLLESAVLAPAQGRYKVYLIDEVHMLTTHSFNALLKTLEEPPEHVKFLLATTEAKKVPVTVLSRCLQFNLKNMRSDVIEGQLAKILAAEEIAAEPPGLAAIARAGNGSMRDALSIADQAVAHGSGAITLESVNEMLGVAGRDEIGALLAALSAADSERLLAAGDDLASRSLDLAGVLDDLQRAFHDLAVAAELKSEPEASYLRFGKSFSAEDLQLLYQIALMGRRDIELAPDPKIGFDMTLLRLASFEPVGSPDPTDADIPSPGDDAPQRLPVPDAQRLEPMSNVEGTATAVVGGAATVESREPTQATADWHEIVNAMAPEGVTAMILRNSNLTDRGPERWLIRLDSAHESLLNDKQRREIGRLATDYAGGKLRVDYEVGDLSDETPMARELRLAKESRERAETELMKDPNVRALVEEFGGSLDNARLLGDDGAREGSPP
ncbi:MAG: DNA polymerase III subunit gamma/tau [Gammaproteobacteria bacterium]|nr:DNA polymerase III subunit gamma/tau [Gammaproteobacteria bacterium]